MSDIESYFLLGIDRELIYALGKVVKEFKGSERVFWDDHISWEKSEKTLQLLDDIVDEINSLDCDEVYFIGPTYINHVTYLKNRLVGGSTNICVKSEFENFLNQFLEKHNNHNPFLETTDSKEFFGERFKQFPTFEFRKDYSTENYFKEYYDLCEKRMDALTGYHFLEEDFLMKRKVDSKVSHALGLNREIYKYFEDFRTEEIQRKTSYGSDLLSTTEMMLNSFVRPSEFDIFKVQVYKFIESYIELLNSEDQKKLDITWRVHLDLSDFYVDWEKSEISKDYLYSSFYELKGKLMKYIDVKFSCFDENIHGCNDIRRHSIRNYSEEYDCFVWLDPDVLFPRRILKTINSFLPRIEKNYFFYALTPEFLYSESGYLEPLVSDKEMNVERPNCHDMETVNNDSVSLEKIDYFRVCGSFTMISTSFLSVSDIPEELGHYGNDDIYTSESMKIFNDYTDDSFHILLYKLKNLIVTQIRESDKKEKQFKKFFTERKNEDTDKVELHRKTESVLDKLYDRIKDKVNEIKLEKEIEQKKYEEDGEQ